MDKTKSKFRMISNEAVTPNRKLSSTIISEPVQSVNTINTSLNVSPTLIDEMNNNSLNLSHVIELQSGKVFLYWEEKKFSLNDITNSFSKYEMHILDYYR
jgi:hypothetical protein